MKIGLIAGSFDPVTIGHMALFEKAINLVDQLYIVVAKNEKKPGYLDLKLRIDCVTASVIDGLSVDQGRRVKVISSDYKTLTVDMCDRLGVDVMFRGLRNVTDFEYERDLGQWNTELAAHIPTVYLMTAPHLAHVSSSAIRSLIGLRDWEARVSPYVHPYTLKALAAKQFIVDKGYTVIEP